MVRVYRIEDRTRLGNRSYLSLKVDRSTTVRQFKKYVQAKTGVPPERQRYHGVSNLCDLPSSGCGRWSNRFDTPEILEDDDRLVGLTLIDLHRKRQVEYTGSVGLIVLPQEGAESERDEDEPRVIRRVDTVEERIAAGRTNAIEIGDDSDSNNGDDHPGAPPPKRQRRSQYNERTDEADGNNGGGDEEAREVNQRDDDCNETGYNGNVASAIQEGGDGGDEDSDNGEDAEGGRANTGGEIAGDCAAMNAAYEPFIDEPGTATAPAVAAAAVPARTAVGEPAVSQLCRWLRSLDANGNATGRFERYAPALERQFDSLAELALVPETEGAWTRTVQACGICKVGDEVMLMRAIRRLPRPA